MKVKMYTAEETPEGTELVSIELNGVAIHVYPYPHEGGKVIIDVDDDGVDASEIVRFYINDGAIYPQ